MKNQHAFKYKSSIEKVAEFILSLNNNSRNDLSGVAVIFPGKRPSLFLKQELSNAIKKPYFSPQVFTINSFVDYSLRKVSDIANISDMNLCYFIYNIAIKLDIFKSTRSFSSFLPWALEIAKLIEQLDMEYVDKDSLENLSANAIIGYDIPKHINEMLINIFALRESFHAYMRKKRQYSNGFKYLEVAKNISKMTFDEFDYVLICDFLNFSKTEFIIFDELNKREIAKFFFEGHENTWEKASCKSEYLNKDNVFKEIISSETNVSFYAGFDTHSQIGIAKDLLLSLKNNTKTVVVLPNPDNVIPFLSDVSSDIDNFNVSMGYPLNRSTLFSLVKLIFKVQSTAKNNRYYVRDYLSLLRHPLIKNLMFHENPAVMRVLVHKVEEILLGIEKTDLGGSLFVSLSEIEDLDKIYQLSLDVLKGMDVLDITDEDLRKSLLSLHATAFVIWENIINLWELVLAMEQFLDVIVNKSFVKNYPVNLSVINIIYKFVDDIKIAEYKEETFSKEEVFLIVENYLNSLRLSFSGTPLKGLQILGVLETRSLEFDNVIMLDVNEGVIPQIQRFSPLIPREVLHDLGLRSIEKDELTQRYYFARLLKCAKNVHLIYNNSSDKERSRFIEEIFWHRQNKTKKMQEDIVVNYYFKSNAYQKTVDIKKEDYILEYLKNDFVFSASSINTYMECSLRFYYQYVLRLKEKEDFLEEPEGVDIGNFIHKFLENIFTPYLGKKPDFGNVFRTEFFREFERSFEIEFAKKMKSDAFMLKAVMQHRLEKFFDFEKRRNVKEIIGLEKEYKEKLEIGKHRLFFTAYVDRLDKLDSGKVLILDYKTGGTVGMPVDTKKLSEMQLMSTQDIKKNIRSFQMPLYIYFVEKDMPGCEIDAALYYLKNIKLDCFSRKVKDEYPFTESMPIYMHALEFVLDEIFDNKVSFKAAEDVLTNCKYCAFKAVCAK